jgi:succinate dehydrogenase / fumarate reductase membrane anchor subunit
VSRGNASTTDTHAAPLRPTGHVGGHWVAERVVSIALLVLGTWLIASLFLLPSLDQRTLAEWLRAPSGAVPMALFVILSFLHGLDGMKVVVDDYVQDKGNHFAINTVLLFAAVGGAGLALFSLARIAFGGEA